MVQSNSLYPDGFFAAPILCWPNGIAVHCNIFPSHSLDKQMPQIFMFLHLQNISTRSLPTTHFIHVLSSYYISMNLLPFFPRPILPHMQFTFGCGIDIYHLNHSHVKVTSSRIHLESKNNKRKKERLTSFSNQFQ